MQVVHNNLYTKYCTACILVPFHQLITCWLWHSIRWDNRLHTDHRVYSLRSVGRPDRGTRNQCILDTADGIFCTQLYQPKRAEQHRLALTVQPIRNNNHSDKFRFCVNISPKNKYYLYYVHLEHQHHC